MAVKTIVIEPNKVEWLLKSLDASSDNPTRDRAMLACLFALGMKTVELAQLRVDDVLNANGDYISDGENMIRQEIAFNGKQRPLCFVNKRLIKMLDAYLEQRYQQQIGIGRGESYRGLNPASSLFFNRSGQPFAVATRQTEAGGLSVTAEPLNRHVRQLMNKAGIEANADSCRRTFAVTLQRKGYSVADIHFMLGNSDVRTTEKMLESDSDRLGAIAARAF